MATWQVQDAKTWFSELIERARTDGPQTITRHGVERAVMLSIEDFRVLAAHKPDFKAHLLGAPKLTIFPSSAIAIPAAFLGFDLWPRAIFWIPTSSQRTEKNRGDRNVIAFLRAADAVALFLRF